jgi:hypothetical protein
LIHPEEKCWYKFGDFWSWRAGEDPLSHVVDRKRWKSKITDDEKRWKSKITDD